MKQSNVARYQAIARAFAARGARNEDVHAAMGGAMASRKATAMNDVGWRIFAGNYERFMTMLGPQASSVGLWRVNSADPTQPHGRFARSFQHSTQRSRSAAGVNDVGGDNEIDDTQYELAEGYLRFHIFLVPSSSPRTPSVCRWC